MIKGTNKYEKLGKSLSGIYTVQTLVERLKVSEKKAIYVIYRLKKLGYVKTYYGNRKKRVYFISNENRFKRVSYTQIINDISPIKLVTSDPYYIYGRIPSYEEVLVYALKQKNVRHVIASLVLFRKINDWSLLYKMAKKEGMEREIGALYEVARKIVKKIKRMPKRYYNLIIPKKSENYIFIINDLRSDDFKDIEKKWKVYIPLNFADLEDYKYDKY